MIARLWVLLPSPIAVPVAEQYPIYEYADDGYGVVVFPPGRSDRAVPADEFDEFVIDGRPAIQADVLRIDFRKQSFDRGEDALPDPPVDLMSRAVNSFLVRLRHVARAAHVRPLIAFPTGSWRVRYLNDDETELPRQEGLVRGRGRMRFSMNWVAMPTKVWQDIHDLPLDYVPPPWEELLLDAIAELPRVGPAVVLAATAQEVFISKILDNLARLSSVPPALWEWINDRGYVREPTVEEQYDSLLKFFTGHSLKEDDGKLWESLKNLRTARNAFVHRGTAQLGDVPVSTDVAAAFINYASATVLKIREWLPQELQWAVFSHTVHVEARKKLT